MRILIVVLLALAWLSFANMTLGDTLGYYEAQVVRVVDGDTFEANVEVWPGMKANALVRIYGIDTPEIHGKCELEKMLAQDAKLFATNWLKDNVVIYDVQPDKYGGRVVARVNVHGKEFSQMIIEAGLAHPYYGKTKEAWCKN